MPRLISNTSYVFPLLDIWDSEKVGFKEFLEMFNVFELHHFIGSGRFERFLTYLQIKQELCTRKIHKSLINCKDQIFTDAFTFYSLKQSLN